MLDRARATANFRLVVLRGRAYIERIAPAFQTRDLFTIWGILQLLRRYPGRVPDLDLMFDCVDWPVVHADEYQGDNATAMPPLFRYCGDNETLDVVFPDWSFWGWAEINIKPWDALQKDLNEGNKRVRWIDREPYAYWKGNPDVAAIRQELVKCNVSSKQEWNARIFKQDWIKESKAGYKKSNLASQCTHSIEVVMMGDRYKIYIEGSAWSVSEKYILACDSMTLVIKPKYYDFFSRVLMPTQHYWPVRDDNKCGSIKYAVDWGNSHKKKKISCHSTFCMLITCFSHLPFKNCSQAQQIGKKASKFIQQELSMDYIYDYMFHLLTEYAKLLRFKPTKPPEAVEVCPESLACQAIGREKKFMQDSMVKSANVAGPCNLPPPFSPEEYKKLQQRKEKSIKQVETLDQNASKLEERNASKPEDSNPGERNASKPEDSNPGERNASKPKDSNPEERNASKPEERNASKPEDSNPEERNASKPEERNASKPEDSNPEERNASKPEDSNPEERNASKPKE
uniref:Glycosyl transferase CAP10 domain-containing protein n=1 Tax=Aegilops tauschii TaxID=37682 RepID=M8BUU7_AEGTA